MTNPAGPNGLTPGQWGVTGTDGSIPSKKTQTQDAVTQSLQNQFQSQQFAGLGGGLIAMILSFIGAGIASVLGGFATIIDAIFGTVNDHYVSQLPTITDHSHSITTLQNQFNQLILQGEATVFVGNGLYTPTAGIKSIDVILVGAGAGGGAGVWNVIAANRFSGGGGGGGGEVHTNIPASLLPVDGSGNFTPIAITVGAGGTGGVADFAPGGGGGNTIFGSGGASLTAGGGNGGACGGNPDGSGIGGTGGAGMIPGGNGGTGASESSAGGNGTAGGNSTSAYDLHGGGGGGGGGAGFGGAGAGGGVGGISPGGLAGSPGGDGTIPSAIVATGGGGGGGGISEGARGGDGAAPGGGGGGCGGGISQRGSRGGNGGNGCVWIVEHSA
jgi:hypothetical protein